LKIVGGDSPLDATWIHPENYPAAERLLQKLGVDVANVARGENAASMRELAGSLDRAAVATELGLGRLTLDDIIEALCKPGRDPREDLPPPIFRKDVVKFDDLQQGMELRGTVLNVVDFGAFVDVGLSDSGLVHISQLSAGYVRDPHDVVAVGDQVRVWVASIDAERRRVALTMIAPGTERIRPEKPRRPPRRKQKPAREPVAAAQATDGPPPTSEVQPARPPRPHQPQRERRERRDRRPPQRQPRTGTYEKRATKTLVPITKAMEEGKEFMRSFGDLLQYHQKQKEKKQSGTAGDQHLEGPEPESAANGTPSAGQGDKETTRQGDS
jgi:uncharacterized protein